MQIKIPRLKSELIVANDITIPVYSEGRNCEFLVKMNHLVPNQQRGSYDYNYCKKCSYRGYTYRCLNCSDYIMHNLCVFDVDIKAGTKLIIDRYFIRNGSEEFDSVTFRYHRDKMKARFWLKLNDAEKIEFI